jgi:hypothetical protein
MKAFKMRSGRINTGEKKARFPLYANPKTNSTDGWLLLKKKFLKKSCSQVTTMLCQKNSN